MVNLKIELPEGFLDEEERCGYLVTHKMKEVWAVELDLLNEFMRVCEKYHIKFYANGGTVLGCVRHQGFIPWDDDIDVMLSRNDYKKLCSVSNEFQHPYFFQNEETDPGSFRGHAQLRNSETTALLKNEKNLQLSFNQGIFIDIFPLDNFPDNKEEREKFINKIMKRRKRVYRDIGIIRGIQPQKDFLHIKKTVKSILRKIYSRSDIVKQEYSRYEAEKEKHRNEKTNYCCNLQCASVEKMDDCILDASFLYKSPVYMKFEFLDLPIPQNYDDYLKRLYGNYMEFVKGGSMHGEVFFDTNKCYREYIDKV